MALLFIDGFDHYVTADITKKWTSAGGSGTINTSGGRRSGGALNCINSSSSVTKSVTATSSFVIGFAFNTSGAPALSRAIISLRDAGAAQCELNLNADLTLSVMRNGVALTSGTSSSTLAANAYYYIEWKVTIADSIAASSCKVRVNGVDWITVATGQDTKNTANTTANQVIVGPVGSASATWLYDDLYICDQSGSTNNDFLGDCRIDTQFPNGDGATTNFTCSTGTTHYALVDETAPNTTDYVDSANVGDRDLYDYTNLTALSSSTVYGVQVCAAVNKDDAGARSIALTARSSGTNSDGSTQALSTSQLFYMSVFETDSASAQWTQTSVDSAQFGIKVAA